MCVLKKKSVKVKHKHIWAKHYPKIHASDLFQWNLHSYDIFFSGAKHLLVFVLTYVIFLALVCQPDRPTNKTRAPIGAWKCNFPPFYHRPTDQPTKQTEIGVHREVTLPIICWCRFAPRKFLLPTLFSFPPHPSIKIWSSRIFNIQPFWFATLVPAFDSFDGIP